MDSDVILPSDLPDEDGFIHVKSQHPLVEGSYEDSKKLECKKKLEQYAWELVKLKCDKTCDKDALIAQAYELAEKFIKQTEEKFNE